jgi:XRE family transcriptional regulator, master regulator for biofilm formation
MIGDRIKKQRKEKGYSITELAEQAGVSKSYLSYLERNLKNNPSLQFLTKIAHKLDCSIEYLLEEELIVAEEPSIYDLDKEWVVLLKNAIDYGMSMDDLEEFGDYLKFKNLRVKK